MQFLNQFASVEIMARQLQIQFLVGADTPRDEALPCPPPNQPNNSDSLMSKDGGHATIRWLHERIGDRCDGRVAQRAQSGKEGGLKKGENIGGVGPGD